ncbi:MAG: phage virion morphogenesis protein [Bacteroidales bacterium]|nr:phage virion morphogenesis protein [Bacteroidales bacterium]
MAKDFKHFSAELMRNSRQVAKYIAQDLPRHVAKIAVDHFKVNFNRQGFVNGGLQKWQEVKRRQAPKAKGVAGRRKILHGETQELRNSLQGTPGNKMVTISSDKVYAGVHNEGLQAGSKKSRFTMPKRQFMGQSRELDNEILKRLNSDITRIINK